MRRAEFEPGEQRLTILHRAVYGDREHDLENCAALNINDRINGFEFDRN